MKRLAPLLSLLPLTHATTATQRIPDILERIRYQKEEGLLLRDGADSVLVEDSDVETLYFDQNLDHFSEDPTTFHQRYFYTSRYVHPVGVPQDKDNEKENNKKVLAFLCVGGEGPSIDISVLVNSVHCTGDMIELAGKLFRDHDYDVHLFALEHRYYGESFPPKKEPLGYLRGDQENQDDEFPVDYTHLSSRQAVKDIVSFVTSPQALNHLNSKAGNSVPWITFGGSYPGMLSAWSRLLHPSIIFAAVSNSAPVQAQLDFSAYNEHIGIDLEDEFVGGSEECARVVREGHEEVVALLEGRSDLESEGDSSKDGNGVDRVALIFNVCDGGESLRTSRRNMEVFVGDGLIQVPAQENDPSCTGQVCNVKGLCEAITNHQQANPDKSSMETIAHISSIQSSNSCKNVNWQDYIDWYSTTVKENVNDRSWLYQACSEFGFYQTCNPDSQCPYGKGYHDVSRDLELCQAAFGIDADTVKKNVDSTLSYYGGKSLTPNTENDMGPNNESSPLDILKKIWSKVESVEHGKDSSLDDGQKRILFVNGDVDPWMELSFTERNKDHPSVIVQGASHHFWTHPVKDSDSKEIAAVRQTIHDTVSEWVGVYSMHSGSLLTEEALVMKLE